MSIGVLSGHCGRHTFYQKNKTPAKCLLKGQRFEKTNLLVTSHLVKKGKLNVISYCFASMVAFANGHLMKIDEYVEVVLMSKSKKTRSKVILSSNTKSQQQHIYIPQSSFHSSHIQNSIWPFHKSFMKQLKFSGISL